MMSLLLLTFTVSAVYVSNVYQKAYAAADFPTSDLLSPKIREWINNQMREDLSTPSSSSGPIQQIQSIKLTLSGFPHQTGVSVTNIGLRPSPCHLQNDITCNGFSHIVIPGIGEADTRLLVLPFFLLVFTLVVYELTVQAFPIVHVIPFADQTSVTRTIDIPGIGTGQATVQVS